MNPKPKNPRHIRLNTQRRLVFRVSLKEHMRETCSKKGTIDCWKGRRGGEGGGEEGRREEGGQL